MPNTILLLSPCMLTMQRGPLQICVPFIQKIASYKEKINSENIKLKASTPINIKVLNDELRSHPDREFVSYLIHGLTNGFDTGMQNLPTSFQCKNLKSAINDPATVSSLIEAELEKGYLIGPYDEIPYEHFRINPIGLAEHKYSKKKRLIVDLSAPHQDDNNPSINSLIDKESFSLQYVTIDDAIKLIKSAGHNAWLMKTDITDAFKQIPMNPELWPYHGVKWGGKYYFFVRLVFGSRSSPKIFDNLSKAVCWIAQNNYGIKNLLHLLDDFLAIEPSYVNAKTTMEKLLQVFGKLNIPLGAKKTVWPCTMLEYLGVYLDTTLMEARLPEEKIARLKLVITLWRDNLPNPKGKHLFAYRGHPCVA